MRSIWKGHIRFLLVAIPVRVYNAIETSEQIHLNQLHKDDFGPIAYDKRCKKCGKTVGKDDIIKGYQYSKDQYAIIEPDDIAKIKLKTTKVIDIVGFVDAADIPPMLYESPYFAGPDGEGILARPGPCEHGERGQVGRRRAREVHVDWAEAEGPCDALGRFLPLSAVRPAPRFRSRPLEPLAVGKNVGKNVASAQEKPCMADTARPCPNVQPGGGAQLACLKAHKEELSPACKKKVMQAKIKQEEQKQLEEQQGAQPPPSQP
jgi:hypothetical protein